MQISIWDPLPSEVVGEPPGIGEGGQQRTFEALKTIDVTKGQESDSQHHGQEEEEPEMQGHDLTLMIYHDAIEMKVGRLHRGQRKTSWWDSAWERGNGHHCPLAVNLGPKFVVPAYSAINTRVQ